ncbi:MAG: pentapeptide repeat-containing protein [Nostoc sp. NOS(2021)]|uniref:pentapeptide repeat-containing protein n=1 Tax=Nostoc sp. NOS(2021) TaxID=2815407 RepID=UPI0025D3DE15|nr:pentapeptide repeat-containing protein [Nostoc sp. NOS(2021)]MBN3898316.1 pentapeptide repeat-containing protein [Nostoc sp. NOS(2021)]
MERKVIEVEELLRRYAAGERDFSWIELHVSYVGQDPAWAMGAGSLLNGANLSGINLSNADLRYAGEMNGINAYSKNF